jgi:TATA-box binding protein (TBP) (component of TFIID and TFIIIB)
MFSLMFPTKYREPQEGRTMLLQEAANRVLESLAPVPSLQQQTREVTDIPDIVNIVSTCSLCLTGPQGPGGGKDFINLKALATAIPSAQYEPKKFAAVILRLKEHSTTAALVFKSGKIVCVHGMSPEHGRYAMHCYRLLIEKVRYPMLNDQGKLVICSLENRLQFANRTIHNVVASGNLGVRIDLASLVRDAPQVCSWKPGGFPGLKFRVQLKKPSECRCKELKRLNAQEGIKVKCGCTCRCLMFENGRMVIIGVLSAKQANDVFFSMRALVSDEESGYETSAFPLRKDQRHNARFAALLNLWGVPLTTAAVVTSTKDEADEAIAQFIQQTETKIVPRVAASDTLSTLHATPLGGGGAGDGLSPFLRFCDRGHVANVQFMIDIGAVREEERLAALERIRAARGTNYLKIESILLARM